MMYGVNQLQNSSFKNCPVMGWGGLRRLDSFDFHRVVYATLTIPVVFSITQQLQLYFPIKVAFRYVVENFGW